MTDPQGPRAAAFDLDSIPENVSDAIAVFDAQWRFVYVNRAYELMANKNREELLGRILGEAFPEAVGTVFDLNYRHAMKTQRPLSFEAYYAPLETWFEVRTHPSPDSITILIRNISERKASERALLQSEERFRGVFEAAPIGLAIVNARTGQLLKANAAMLRLLGYSAQELTRLRFDEITHPDDRAASIDFTEKLSRGLFRDHVWVKRYLKKDGSAIHAIAHINMLPSDSGEDPTILGMIEDITERLRTEEAVRLNSERLALAQEAGGIGVYEIDLVSETTICTPEAEKLYGVDRGTFSRDLLKWMEYVHKDDLPRVREIFNQATTQKTAGQMEFRIVRPDETAIRWISNIWRFRSEKDGPANRAIGVSMDVTERNNARESLLQHQDRLRRMATELSLNQARERRELAKEIHDGISQDLAAAKLQLRMLDSSSLPAESAELVNHAHELIARAIERTRAVTFGLSPPALFELGFTSAVERLIEDLRRLYDLNIHFQRPANSRRSLDEGPKVVAFRAVRELLMNVVKHARARNAGVTIERRDQKLVLTVADDGIGFDVEATELRDTFGLFSIREQIESLGGALVIRSGAGTGTTVTLTLPAANPAATNRRTG